MALLTIQSVSKNFSGVQALDDVSFAIEKGSITGLIGPNGAGKTTLFQCITGQVLPTSGTILCNGQKLTGKTPNQIANLGICRTFQHQRIFQSLSVLENVLVGMHNNFETILFSKKKSSDEKKYKTKASELLAFVGLAGSEEIQATSLSYGQQKKLEIARALAGDPTLLLLDEPAAGLHEKETDALRDLLKKLQEQGITILIVEHDMSLIMAISSHLIVLNFGKKIADGSPTEIKKHPEVVKAYLGDTP